MALPQLKEEEKFSYSDYRLWDDHQRWELIDGEAYLMSPAPSRQNQKYLGELFVQFSNYLEDKTCEVYIAPLDVRFPDSEDDSDEEILTVVQPDLVLVCDPEKLDDHGCKGAPDIVVEILSPSTSKRDISVKYELYQRYGVKEYWILYPNEQILQIYQLKNDNRYSTPNVFGKGDLVPVQLLGELVVDMSKVFR